MIDAFSELRSPFLKEGNSVPIAVIVSAVYSKKLNIGHSNNYGPNGPNRKKIGSNY